MMPDHATTRTGSFPIGIRLTGSAWCNSATELAGWLNANRFAFADLGHDRLEAIAEFQALGVGVGTVDLLPFSSFTGMLSADPGRRAGAVAEAIRTIETATASGVTRFLTVMLAEDVTLPRVQTFRHMVASYSQLLPLLESRGAVLCIEGWPGMNALCCNPETCRALFAELPSSALGLNFDPSHLIRMGIDPRLFLADFAARVRHVHGKDTLIDRARLQEIGHEQAATFTPHFPWGGAVWRYTLPGWGEAPWTGLLSTLADAGYAGGIGVELEDMDYNGSEPGEKRGFLDSRNFLAES